MSTWNFASPSPFARTARHLRLAALWCQWNGKKGTAKQSAAIASRLPEDVLARMLRERGVEIPQ